MNGNIGQRAGAGRRQRSTQAYESDTVAEKERRAPAKRDTAVRIRPVSSMKGEEAMTTFELVEHGTILRATVGSTVHGLHHGGQDDRDEMAVFMAFSGPAAPGMRSSRNAR